MTKITSCKDFIMLLLYAKGHKGGKCEPIRGKTRLMKMIFIFDEEIRRKFNTEKAIIEDIPKFEPNKYGPFSSRVFSDLEFLVELGFVKVYPVSNSEISNEEAYEYDYWQARTGPSDDFEGTNNEEEFSLTEVGQSFVEEGEAGILTDKQKKILNEFKARCTGTSLRNLLEYVYNKYPEMTTKSKIRNEIMSR